MVSSSKFGNSAKPGLGTACGFGEIAIVPCEQIRISPEQTSHLPCRESMHGKRRKFRKRRVSDRLRRSSHVSSHYLTWTTTGALNGFYSCCGLYGHYFPPTRQNLASRTLASRFNDTKWWNVSSACAVSPRGCQPDIRKACFLRAPFFKGGG